MSKFKSVVSMLTGYVRVHNNLTFYEENRIVINSRNDRSDDKRVKLISGGGSGHEPAHAGYVGDGMLTTSVIGDIYSSPSVQHMLDAALETGAPHSSILILINNYTGDRLNFTLALELAKNRYKYQNIDVIIISDDISIDDSKIQKSVGRRALVGTVFYYKIIGAMAANEKTLVDIVDYVRYLINNHIICSVGFGFNTNVPEGICDIEIGKGIHGEKGFEFIKNLDNFDIVYQKLLDKFLVKIPKTSDIVLILNNSGGTTQFMMNILMNEITQKFSEHYKIIKTYSGNFLTSLNSEGICVTLINLSNPKNLVDIIKYLEYETSVPCNIFEVNQKPVESQKSVIKRSIEVRQSTNQVEIISSFQNADHSVLFKNIVVRCADDLLSNTDLLNNIDAEFGDGDTGSGLAIYSNEVKRLMENNILSNFDNPKMILDQLGDTARSVVGGTTGAIYCLFFQGALSVIEPDVKVDLKVWAAALKAGIAIIMKYGQAQKGDRTILEPLIACSDALENFKGIDNLNKLCDEAVTATQDMIPKSGRAAYMFSMDQTAHKAKNPDAGAKAIGIMINGICNEISKFK